MKDLKALLKVVLDPSGIGKSAIAKVQNILKKYQLKLSVGLNKAELMEAAKQVISELKSKLKKATGIDIKMNSGDIKKDVTEAIKDQRKLQKEVGKTVDEVKKLSTIDSIKPQADNNSGALKPFGGNIDSTTNKTNKVNLFDSLKKTAGRVGSWLFESDGITMVINGFNKIKDASIELNETVAGLSMATGASKKELQSYIESYSKLGDELGATVIDVAKSGTEWLKQGKTIAETEDLIRSSMVLSKVGKMSSADATEYLTNIMKDYEVSIGDTLGVVDKLYAVDMNSSADIGGLVEGMSEVADNAKLAGVSIDTLLGYLTAIGEVSQSGMSEAGTSLDSVFSRMGNIKLGKLKDYQNSGEDISNVETVLKSAGISLRDSQNSFRDFDEVLTETASNWNNYSEVQQQAIANAFAGTDHMGNFIVLMENFSTAQKYTETSLNSSGQAMETFSAYQDSVAAHTERLSNAFIGLSNTLVDSGAINFFLDLGTALIKGADGIVSFLTPLGALGAGIGITEFVKNFDRSCKKDFLKIA
ncbi:phage tail tape measure protein [Lacrimispora sp.]|uniref:phage tail tape measure protein n=1 Tax=Lacrimispora sp. TaxID=2719234 RepID=UPI002FDB473A